MTICQYLAFNGIIKLSLFKMFSFFSFVCKSIRIIPLFEFFRILRNTNFNVLHCWYKLALSQRKMLVLWQTFTSSLAQHNIPRL